MAYADKEKRKKYFRERHHKMMSWAIEYHGNQCRCCGGKESLELHHKDSSVKKLNVSRMLHYSFSIFEEEVKKCIILCCDCHSFQRRSSLHGITRYSKYGCRCLICKTAWNKNHQRWRLSLTGKTANR